MTIHPTAIIADSAEIDPSAEIGPYCTIGPQVMVGPRTKIHSHVVINGYTAIGEANEIFPFVSLGQAPQDLKFEGECARLVIGDRNVIRESVTMNVGTGADRLETTIGNDNLFMALTHVAHDCIVKNNCIMANGAMLAGHVTLEDGARLGGLAAVAQFTRVGKYAFVGGMVGVEQDLPPYTKLTQLGVLSLNVVGLRRMGIENGSLQALQQTFDALFGEERTLPRAEIAQDMLDNDDGNMTPEQEAFINFVLAGPRKRERIQKDAPSA